MKSKLDLIEARLQALIENRFTWLDLRGSHPRLGSQIVDALRNTLLADGEDTRILPNVIQFSMHPDNVNAWKAHPEWMEWLEHTIQETISEAGLYFSAPLAIQLQADQSLKKNGLNVETYSTQTTADSTTALTGITRTVPEPVKRASAHCYLILNGDQYFPLNEAVINLGRRDDNHIVFEDPRVSRTHAQIRKVHQDFILFDLNSTGGTFVNGNRITQYSLKPGVVISLAGVAIIYGEETQTDDSRSGTAPTAYT